MNNLSSLFSKTTLNEKFKKAYIHAQTYGQLNDLIFAHHFFTIKIGDLLQAAMGTSVLNIQNNLEKMFEFMLQHKTQNTIFWEFQDFSISLGEILYSALNNINPQSVKTIEDDMNRFHEEYNNLYYSYIN